MHCFNTGLPDADAVIRVFAQCAAVKDSYGSMLKDFHLYITELTHLATFHKLLRYDETAMLDDWLSNGDCPG